MTRLAAGGAAPAPEVDARALVAVEWRATADGRVAARVRGERGRWVALHETSDPLADAHVQLDALAAAPDVLVIVGAGLGYLTEAALLRWEATTVVVVEPHEALASAARARRPALYTSPRVRLVTGPGYDGAADLWRVLDTPAVTTEAPPLVADVVLGAAWPTLMREAARVVGRALAAARMNAGARAENAGRYVTNTLQNLRHIVAGPDPARLRGQFTGVPAIVVGAGPSLDACLPALRELAGRALVIATDTAWRPLVHGGVTPHLVVALDPTPENGQHLVGVPDSGRTWIVAEGSVDPAALATLDGRVATFRVAAHHPWPWLAPYLDRLHLRAWGSVLTSAFDLALVCDCDPVIFVGADLAFTGGQPYCRGTTFEESWARHAARGVSLRRVWDNTLASRALATEPDIHGAPTVTAPHLLEFRDWLAARAAEAAPRRILNASAAGILYGSGIRQTDVATALARRDSCEGLVRAAIDTALGDAGDPECRRRVVAALDAVAHAEPGTAPVADWIGFGRPNLNISHVHHAALAGRAALMTAPSLAPPVAAAPRLRWHVADRVATARAQLTGDESGLVGTAPPEPRPDLRTAADEVALIDTLLQMPVIVTGCGDDVGAGAAPDVVPLSARYCWSAEATPWIAALEEAQIERTRYAARPVVPDDADYYLEPIGRVELPGTAASHAETTLDARARVTLLTEHVVVSERDAGGTRERRLAAATRRALATPALGVPLAQGIEIVLAGRSIRVPVAVDSLMRAVTGTLVLADGRGEPRTAFLGAACDHLEPEVLTRHGLPRGWSVVTSGPDHALFVPADGAHSVRLDAEGRVACATVWPSKITGEVPWGPAGGALAWNAVTRAVQWRTAPDAPPLLAEAPFKPAHVAVAPDDAPFWCDVTGQLWQWTPGKAARRVAALPLAGIPRFEECGLAVAPMPRDGAGRVVRTRLAYEWHVDTVSGTFATIPIGSEGQVAKRASREGWTAATHPCADLVRLSAPGRAAMWLACCAPAGVAWAGASLVVIAGGSTPLLFPRLLDRLAADGRGPRLPP